MIEQFNDRLSQLLVVVTIVSAITAATHGGGWEAFLEPGIISIVLIGNAMLGSWQVINIK